MQLHNVGDQFSNKSIEDIINSFKSLQEQYNTEFKEAKKAYETSGSTLIANQAMLGALAQGLDFMLKGETLIIETHRQLASAIGQTSTFNRIYKV